MDAILSFFRSIFRAIFGGEKPDPTPADLPFSDTLDDAPVPQAEPKQEKKAEPVDERDSTPTDHTGSFSFEPDSDPNVLLVDLVRNSSGKYDSLGTLYVQGEELCRTLEDEYREAVVAGETRIPSGTYEIALRKAGGRHPTYMYRFPNMHKGMLWIKDVPGFPYALICIGNRESDTEGSILVGTQAVDEDKPESRREIWYSEQAYRRLYPLIAEHLIADKPVTLRVQ